MAEELIEMGQTALPAAEVPSTGRRMVSLSREEAEIVVRMVDSVAKFSREFPIEFHSYCPVDRWKTVLEIAGGAVRDIERQLAGGAFQVAIDASSLMATMDLEECLAGARDSRLSSSKIALAVSAAGAVGEIILGLPWLGLPAYIISLAMVLGRPLAEKIKETPAEPFRVGSRMAGCSRLGNNGNGNEVKLIERVFVSRFRSLQRHYWGEVRPTEQEGAPAAFCLAKGIFRVRVEGQEGDIVTAIDGWSEVPESDCTEAANEVAVWEPCGDPPESPFGPVWEKSRHEGTVWVEYSGPLTDGVCRRAGPFGCTVDTRMHAMEDGGITERGVDGDWVSMDSDGNVIDEREG